MKKLWFNLIDFGKLFCKLIPIRKGYKKYNAIPKVFKRIVINGLFAIEKLDNNRANIRNGNICQCFNLSIFFIVI